MSNKNQRNKILKFSFGKKLNNLIYKFEPHKFYRIDGLNSYKENKDSFKIITLFKSPIINKNFEIINSPVQMDLGNIYPFYNHALFIGYFLELQKYQLLIEDNHLKLIKEQPNIKDEAIIHVNNMNISVREIVDKALLVTLYSKKYIDTNNL